MSGETQSYSEGVEDPNLGERRERVRQWVAALRSGNYEQGQRRLNTDNKFCCLGVACEVAIANGLDLGRDINEETQICTYGRGEFINDSYLPHPVSQWLGLVAPPVHNPKLRIPHQTWEAFRRRHLDVDCNCGISANPPEAAVNADYLNDNLKMNFAEIADCIEYTLLREDWDAAHGQAVQ